jgi:uncharacterized protein (DUF1697 family)
MPRYIAFLRGINVGGGHIVKMQELRRLFESYGFSGVESVIQSGNVIFESSETKSREMERMIEDRLERELGYRVATFLRTAPELAAIARHRPFGPAENAAGATLYVVFLRGKPSDELEKALRLLNTDNDKLEIGKREIYWLRRMRLKESTSFGALLARTVGADTSVRNMTTIRKIADKYC